MKYYHDLIGGAGNISFLNVRFITVPTNQINIELPNTSNSDELLVTRVREIQKYKEENKDAYELYTMVSTNKVITPEKREERKQQKITEIRKLEQKLEKPKVSKLETQIPELQTQISKLEDDDEFNKFDKLYNITLNGITYRFFIYHNLPDMFSLELGNNIYTYMITK
jgi:hypothetical protein